MIRKAMRSALGMFLLTLVVAPAAFANTTGAATLDERWKKAMLAGDLEGVVACYGKGSVLWLPGEPEARGIEQIRAAYKAFLDANTIKSFVVSETTYRTMGSLSTGWGRYTMTFTPKSGGADVVTTGRFTCTATRYKARWVYLADHASADPSPAAAPAKKK